MVEKIYESFLLSAGRCFKSSNKLAHYYGKTVVFILSYAFHIKHYSKADILEEIRLRAPEKSKDKKYFRKVQRAYFKYRCSAREYFVCGFEDKTPEEIKSYLMNIEKIVLITLINNRKVIKTLNAKEKCYTLFKPFYGREIISFSDNVSVSKERFSDFVKKHNAFICKPSNLSLARGIQKYNIIDFSSIGGLYNEILSKKPVIIEELIYNDKSFSMFHERSLNIVRIVVFRLRTGEIKIQRAYMGIGIGNKDYANTGAGSIAVPININTGKTCGRGFTQDGGVYDVHPDSGVKLTDYQVERWDELMELVHKLSTIMPEIKYVGWDFALTPKGWIIVEGNGNAGQTIHQIMDSKSVYKEFLNLYMQT